MGIPILYETSFFLYHIFLVPVIFLSVVFYILALTNIFLKPNKYRQKNDTEEWPSVTIQIATYNDPIAVRLLKNCLKFDYPDDKFDVIVADDSTDKKVTNLITKFASNYPNKIKVVHRDNRNGFKPGALNNILKHTKGEIIVLFDSDFTSPKTFLKRIVTPIIEDPKIGIVQSRMGYINPNQNIITKIASTFLMIYHQCIITINDKLNIPFFCGTHGAIRKDLILKLGGWNEKSITEDTDLSLKTFKAGYKSVYLSDLKSSGELPFTLNSFIKQQMRWAYGNTRAFIDHATNIWSSKTFTFLQRIMLTFTTLGNVGTFFIIGMTAMGVISMLTGEPHPLTLDDFKRFFGTFIATGGFMATTILALRREDNLRMIKSVFLGALTVGIVIATTNSLAVIQALAGKKMGWIRTPKLGNFSIFKSKGN